MKAVIRDGDPTTTGGRVFASAATMGDNGRAAALDGEPATCGNCPGQHPIKGSGGEDMGENGRSVVLDGDEVMCPCGKNFVQIGPSRGLFVEVGDAVVASAAGWGIGPAGISAAVTTLAPATSSPQSLLADNSASTSLDGAQPFDYQPDMPDGDVEQLAGGEGTPGNNQAQNRQFKAVIKALGLNQSQARQLHEEISKQGLGYHEMLEREQDMFGGSGD